MKLLTLTLLMSLSSILYSQNKTFHDFKAVDIDGNKVKMSDYKGKKIMVVNVASKCGYTYQYKYLQEIYEKYKDQNFVIIAFPANNFMNQEPGTDDEIKTFCSTKYNVTFPVMSKISVIGKDIHPIYKWLTQKDQNGVLDAPVKWNFQKFLIDENGKLVKVVMTKTDPNDKEITDWIEGKYTEAP